MRLCHIATNKRLNFDILHKIKILKKLPKRFETF